MYCNHGVTSKASRFAPGRIAQSVGHLTRKSEVLGSIPFWPHTFVSPSADSRGAVVSYWRKYVHEVLVNRLGGLSLPRKSVVRLTDRPVDVKQQINNNNNSRFAFRVVLYFTIEYRKTIRFICFE